MPHPLIEQADFQLLLPWAKAVAKALEAPELEHRHFLLAAQRLAVAGQLELPASLLGLLDEAVGPAASRLDIAEPWTGKLPLHTRLRESLALDGHRTLADWLEQVLGQTQAAPAAQEPDPAADPGLAALTPYLHGAMRALGEQALTTRGLGLGLVHALDAGALDGQYDLRHFCEGHADELRFWLEHSGAMPAQALQAGDSDMRLDLAPALRTAAAQDMDRFKAPTPLWRWLHAAIGEANEYAWRLQVAFHEAGHAVAIHVLIPEGIYEKITIQPEGDAGGMVVHDRNDAYNNLYGNSLEHVMESAVVAMAGRAAEVRRFGHLRATPGALSDMAHASQHCWRAITAFGLDPVFGPIVPAPLLAKPDSESPFIAMAPTGWLHDLAQQRLHAWMAWAHGEAQRLVDHHWDLVVGLAEEVMRRTTLHNDEARALLSRWTAEPYRLTPLPERG